MTSCTVPGCTRRVMGHGLCNRHYRRQRRGVPLVDDRDRLGQPDGHGHYGELDDDGTTVGCHECDLRFKALARHLQYTHGMTPEQYRQAHGLPRGLALQPAALVQAAADRARARIGTPGWLRFEQQRDPAVAAAARTTEQRGPRSPVTAARNAELALTNSRRTRRPRVIACVVCGAEWCPLPGGYRRRICGSHECRSAIARARRPKGSAAIADRDITLHVDVVAELRGYDVDDPQLWSRVDELYAGGTRQGELAGVLGLSAATVSVRRRRA